MRVFIASLLLACMAVCAALADTTGGIRGYVYDVENHPQPVPIEGATVVISAPHAYVMTTTDDNGFFVALGLPPGHYDIVVRDVAGYPVWTKRCVSAGAMVDVRFNVWPTLKVLTRRVPYRWFVLPDPSQTSDVYNLVGDQQRPC